MCVLARRRTDPEIHQVQNIWFHIVSLLELKKECHHQKQNFEWSARLPWCQISGTREKISHAHWERATPHPTTDSTRWGVSFTVPKMQDYICKHRSTAF